MYEFSRAIYRRLADQIDTTLCPGAHHRVLTSCETTMQRIASDPHSCPRPSRQLFREIRGYFPLSAQTHVKTVVEHYVACAKRSAVYAHDDGVAPPTIGPDCHGRTRAGEPCRRTPLPGTSYCPSHKHLAGAVALAA
jgi:hypothetical protein